jgi:hypothetical protein
MTTEMMYTSFLASSRVTGHCPGNAPGESQPVTSPEKGELKNENRKNHKP